VHRWRLTELIELTELREKHEVVSIARKYKGTTYLGNCKLKIIEK
jgi:hypothetical protein